MLDKEGRENEGRNSQRGKKVRCVTQQSSAHDSNHTHNPPWKGGETGLRLLDHIHVARGSRYFVQGLSIVMGGH